MTDDKPKTDPNRIDNQLREPNIADRPYVVDPPEGNVKIEAAIPFATATQRSFAAAGNQFAVLTQFGSARPDAAPIGDRVTATNDARQRYQDIFVRDRVIQFDQNGYRGVQEYLRAAEVIRAKAVALGYGPLSESVDITSVPGGYVGRFGGHDIYAAS